MGVFTLSPKHRNNLLGSRRKLIRPRKACELSDSVSFQKKLRPTAFLGMTYLEAVLSDLARKPAYQHSGPATLLLKSLGKVPEA